MINGFELDTPNVAKQATNPTPADGDEHVDCDSGQRDAVVEGRASGATSHDVYFGEDLTALQSATRTSPLFKGNQTGTTFAVSGFYSMKTYYWRIDEVDAQNVADARQRLVLPPAPAGVPARPRATGASRAAGAAASSCT